MCNCVNSQVKALSAQTGAVFQLAPALASNILIKLLKFAHLKKFTIYSSNSLHLMITSGSRISFYKWWSHW